MLDLLVLAPIGVMAASAATTRFPSSMRQFLALTCWGYRFQLKQILLLMVFQMLTQVTDQFLCRTKGHGGGDYGGEGKGLGE